MTGHFDALSGWRNPIGFSTSTPWFSQAGSMSGRASTARTVASFALMTQAEKSSGPVRSREGSSLLRLSRLFGKKGLSSIS